LTITKCRLLAQTVAHADETTFQVLNEENKTPQSKSYLWVYRTSVDTNEPIIFAEYKPNRKAKNPKEFLANFKGYLHTDGYEAYHSLPDDITVVGFRSFASQNRASRAGLLSGSLLGSCATKMGFGFENHQSRRS